MFVVMLSRSDLIGNRPFPVFASRDGGKASAELKKNVEIERWEVTHASVRLEKRPSRVYFLSYDPAYAGPETE